VVRLRGDDLAALFAEDCVYEDLAVPVTTILQLDSELITRNSDNYNLAVVLRRSGLPADWTPGV
jgi:hypothetical protein